MILIYSNFDPDRSTSPFWSNRGLKSWTKLRPHPNKASEKDDGN